MTDRIEKVCMVRFGGMGDILLATPALRAVSRTFQTDAIDVIVGKNMSDAVRGTAYIRRVMEWDKRGADARIANFARFLLDLRRERYDLFLNFQPGTRSHLMAWAAGANQTVTFAKNRRKQPETGRVRHAIDDFSKELKPLGIETVADRRMDFHVPNVARDSVRTTLAGCGITGAYLVANPAASHAVNRYSPERLGAMIAQVAALRPEMAWVVTGTASEQPLADAVVAATLSTLRGGRVVSLAGKLSVKELGALLAGAACVVTADTGPLHIASAVGTPLVCLFGAADPDRTGPILPRDLVISRRDLSCLPCQSRTCRRGDIACMTGLPVEWVVSAVIKQLENP
ncbi:MAG: glycosyltransferase family 9 protein [Fibrella sp.]|nr:glycosyltransferase family 9 protein [Armatimonadota bacterium]